MTVFTKFLQPPCPTVLVFSFFVDFFSIFPLFSRYHRKVCVTMLTIALQKMIDRCECILFLNTNQSILPYEKPEDDATYSPWIYSEIVCTQLIRHKELKEYRKEIFHGDQRALFEASEGFHPAYSVSLDHMMPLNMGDLMEWEQNYPKNTPKHHPLDYLYKQLAARN